MSGIKASADDGKIANKPTMTQRASKTYGETMEKFYGFFSSKDNAASKVTKDVPCDLLPIFMQEGMQSLSRKQHATYSELIESCRKMKGKENKSKEIITVQIPELDLLLVPFKRCVDKANRSSQVDSCWKSYGKFIQAYPDA